MNDKLAFFDTNILVYAFEQSKEQHGIVNNLYKRAILRILDGR